MQFELYLSVCILSAVAVIGAECRHLSESQSPVARNSTPPCSLEMASICSTLQDTDSYSLQLDIQSSGEIKGAKLKPANSVALISTLLAVTSSLHA